MGERRSLERHRLDAVVLEDRQEPQQLAGEEDAERAVLLDVVTQRGERRRRHAVGTDARQVAVEECPEPMARGERRHAIPVQAGVDERPHLRGAPGLHRGPAAVEEQGGLAILVRAQVGDGRERSRALQREHDSNLASRCGRLKVTT